MNQNDLKCVKFIAFDLDTKQLKMFMDRYQTAYEKIKNLCLIIILNMNKGLAIFLK